MKIAVFGDSFADTHPTTKQSWVQKLGSLDKNYKIKNFAKAGSSLWWSYKKFCKNIESYEAIVFVLTRYGRLSFEDHHISGLETLNFINPELESQYPGISKSIEHYFLILQDDQQEVFLHNKIIEDIKKRCKKTNKRLVLLPAFDCTIHHQDIFEIGLHNITMKEIETATGSKKFIPETPRRVNHLSEMNRQILANIVHDILQGRCNTKIGIDNFVYETYSDLKKYWHI